MIAQTGLPLASISELRADYPLLYSQVVAEAYRIRDRQIAAASLAGYEEPRT